MAVSPLRWPRELAGESPGCSTPTTLRFSRPVLVKPRSRVRASAAVLQAWAKFPTKPAPSFAALEARKALQALRLPSTTMDVVDDFLDSVCTADSTVPSVTHGEEPGSVLFHWVAGPMSIEAEVGLGGASYFWALDDRGEEHSLEGPRSEVEPAVRRYVAEMAARVRRNNPGWQIQYLQR